MRLTFDSSGNSGSFNFQVDIGAEVDVRASGDTIELFLFTDLPPMGGYNWLP